MTVIVSAKVMRSLLPEGFLSSSIRRPAGRCLRRALRPTRPVARNMLCLRVALDMKETSPFLVRNNDNTNDPRTEFAFRA